MLIEDLQKLGLSPNEAKIYEALLDLKEAGVGEISSRAEVHRRNVYDTMHRLIDKGLVFFVLSQGETLYSPVDPEKLMELVREKELILQNSLPEFRVLHKKRERIQEAYIYKGFAGMKKYLIDILRVGKTTYSLGAKLGWFDPQLKTFREQFFKEAKRKKIKFYSIFDYEVKESEVPKELSKEHNRFLPKEYSSQSAINIFGDYVVTFTGLKIKRVDDDVTIFVMRDKHLAETYKAWFQFIFDNCSKTL